MRTVVPASDFFAQIDKFDAQLLQILKELMELARFRESSGS
jgi:hypothetical protein